MREGVSLEIKGGHGQKCLAMYKVSKPGICLSGPRPESGLTDGNLALPGRTQQRPEESIWPEPDSEGFKLNFKVGVGGI